MRLLLPTSEGMVEALIALFAAFGDNDKIASKV